MEQVTIKVIDLLSSSNDQNTLLRGWLQNMLRQDYKNVSYSLKFERNGFIKFNQQITFGDIKISQRYDRVMVGSKTLSIFDRKTRELIQEEMMTCTSIVMDERLDELYLIVLVGYELIGEWTYYCIRKYSLSEFLMKGERSRIVWENSKDVTSPFGAFLYGGNLIVLDNSKDGLLVIDRKSGALIGEIHSKFIFGYCMDLNVNNSELIIGSYSRIGSFRIENTLPIPSIIPLCTNDIPSPEIFSICSCGSNNYFLLLDAKNGCIITLNRKDLTVQSKYFEDIYGKRPLGMVLDNSNGYLYVVFEKGVGIYK